MDYYNAIGSSFLGDSSSKRENAANNFLFDDTDNLAYIQAVADDKTALESEEKFAVAISKAWGCEICEADIIPALFIELDAYVDMINEHKKTKRVAYAHLFKEFLSRLPIKMQKSSQELIAKQFDNMINQGINGAIESSSEILDELDDDLSTLNQYMNKRREIIHWTPDIGRMILNVAKKTTKKMKQIKKVFLDIKFPFHYIVNLVDIVETDSCNVSEDTVMKESKVDTVELDGDFNKKAVKNWGSKLKNPATREAVELLGESLRRSELYSLFAYSLLKKRKPSNKKVITGGAVDVKENAENFRKKANEKFAEKYIAAIKEFTSKVYDLVRNPDPKLIEFLADSSSGKLIDALFEIRMPSRIYIPVLSSYYRTSEAGARKKRYMESLMKSSDQLQTLGAGQRVPQSAKNILSGMQSIIMKMHRLIADSAQEMDNIFSKLASSEVDRIVRGDSILSKAGDITKIRPPHKEMGGYTGNDHVKFIDSLTALRARAKRAMAQHATYSNVEKFKDYQNWGREKMVQAVNKEMTKLREHYRDKLNDLEMPPEEKAAYREKASKSIELKLTAYREFYEWLIDNDELLSKININDIKSPEILEDMYAAIAGTDFAVSREGASEIKMKSILSNMQKFLFKDKLWMDEYDKVLSKEELDELTRHINDFFNRAHILRFFLNFPNILEQTKALQFDSERAYKCIARYIAATSFDFGKEENIAKYRQSYLEGKELEVKSPPKLGLHIRHMSCKPTEEDHLFVMILQAMAGRLLIQLDQHRADFDDERTHLPGTERLFIGGALSDPLGHIGDVQIDSDLTKAYIPLIWMSEIYKARFKWEDANGTVKEPQLTTCLPKSSLIREYLLNVYENPAESRGRYSDGFFRQAFGLTNQLASRFAGTISNPEARCKAVTDLFIEEVSSSIRLVTASETARAQADREDEKISEYTTYGMGGELKDDVALTEADIKSKRPMDIKKTVYDALHALTDVVYEMIESTNVSEKQMVNDYVGFIQRTQERISQAPAAERFNILANAIRNSDDVAGDVVTLFMSFTEFVATPLLLANSLLEQVVYKAANLYAVVLRHIFAMEYKGVDRKIHNLWANFKSNKNFQGKLNDVLLMLASGNTDMLANKPEDNIDKKLPMYQSIYKALQNVRLPGTKYIEIHTDGDLQCDFSNVITLFQDIKKHLLVGMEPFSRLGEINVMEKYMHDLATWAPDEIIRFAQDKVNSVIGLVSKTPNLSNQYIPESIVTVGNKQVVLPGVSMYGDFDEILSSEQLGLQVTRERLFSKKIPENKPIDDLLIDNIISRLPRYNSVFAPNGTYMGKPIKMIGHMPWSPKTQGIVEGDMHSAESKIFGMSGTPLNNRGAFYGNQPALNADGTMANDGVGVPVRGDSLKRVLQGAKEYTRGDNSVLMPHMTGPVRSLIYGDSAIESKVEILNRVIAMMVHNLTIHGEEPVLLYEFVNEIMSNSQLNKFFELKDINISVKKPIQYGKLVNCIQTPKIGPEFGGNVVLDEVEFTSGSPVSNIVDKLQEWGNRILYDVVLYPFINSTRARSKKRLDDLSRSDLSKYVALFPHYINVLKELKALIELDKNLTGEQSEKINLDAANDMLSVIDGFVESMYRVYKDAESKYGEPTHMEIVKGDHDAYKAPGGIFDPVRLCTPLSVLSGFASYDDNGPLLLAGLGDAKYKDVSLSLSWMNNVFDKRLTGNVHVKLEALPWTLDLAARVETLTGASMNTGLQIIVDNMCKMGMILNMNNLSGLICHNALSSPHPISGIFHPHILEASMLTLERGFDSMFGLWTTGNFLWMSGLRFTYPFQRVGDAPEGLNSFPNGREGATESTNPRDVFRNRNVMMNIDRLEFAKSDSVPQPITFESLVKRFSNLGSASSRKDEEVDKAFMSYSTQRINKVGAVESIDCVSSIKEGEGGADTISEELRDQLGYVKFTKCDSDGVANTPAQVLAVSKSNSRELEDCDKFMTWTKNRMYMHAVPAVGSSTEDFTNQSFSNWMLNKTNIRKCRENQIGYKVNNNYARIEMAKIYPTAWFDEDNKSDQYNRLTAGMFLQMGRNPVSLSTTLTLVPFPNIWNYSQSFQTYMKVQALRSKRKNGSEKARSYLPALLLEPYSMGKDIMLQSEEYSKLSEKKALTFEDGRYAADYYYNGDKHTLVKDFYAQGEKFSSIPMGVMRPTEESMVKGYAANCFPMFGANIRFVDQISVMLKEEFKERLVEIKISSKDAPVDTQAGVINLFEM